MPSGKDMEIARSVTRRVNEIRLQQALEQAHRARLSFLRQDHYDGDCATCVRRVREAEAQVHRLEALLAVHRTD
jgi:hypothetical protein